MAWSATLFNTNALYQGVNLTAHGFTVGQILGYNGSAWFLAKSDNASDAQVIGMVSNVPDVNSFYISQIGYIANLVTTPVNPPAASYTPGSLYYLDSSHAGQLTLNPPSAVGTIVLPCFIAYTTTSGFFFENAGEPNKSGPLFSWTTATTNTNMGTDQGYFTSSGGTLNMTLPPTGSVGQGDIIRLSNLAGNFALLTNASQTINFVDALVSTSITSTKVGDTLELVCYVASPNALFQVLSSMGNLIYV